AANQHVRAMSPAWPPMVATQPNTTYSTAPGSMQVRSMSDVSACAPRSAGCTCESPPPRRPTGERTASTMKASATDLQLLGDELSMMGGVAERTSEHPSLFQGGRQLVLDGVADRPVALQRPPGRERRRVRRHDLVHRD